MELGGQSPGGPSFALAVLAPVRRMGSRDGRGEEGLILEAPQPRSLLALFGVAAPALGTMQAFWAAAPVTSTPQ